MIAAGLWIGLAKAQEQNAPAAAPPAAPNAVAPTAPNASTPQNQVAAPHPPTPDDICRALEQDAAENELPVEFFARVIWQESRFNARAVSSKGAQGIAQFMPATADYRGLIDPFDPIEALKNSARYLRDLKARFGNLGLAAAAYNAGPGRVSAWLTSRRPLPGETRNYVAIITGWTADEWARASIKSQEAVRISRNADPNALPDFTGFAVTLSQPQKTFSAQIESVEPTINPQRRSEPPGSARQIAQTLDATIEPHDRDAFERLKRPDEDAGSDPGHLARYIQHV